jgi:hypothetical protein
MRRIAYDNLIKVANIDRKVAVSVRGLAKISDVTVPANP